MRYTDVICSFCGTLCDDIEVVVEDNRIVDVKHACRIGTAKFLSSNELEHRLLKPMVRKNGKLVETSLDEALDRAAGILKSAIKPLLYGWSSTSCEAQSAGIELAEELGGVIDATVTVCHGPSVLAVHDAGYPGCTLGEVKNRADLVIYWGSNPMHGHPRHLSRYSIFPRGYFRERGQSDRELVVVDVRKTDTAKIANRFIKVNYGEDYELISALRKVVNGGELREESVAGVPRKEIIELAEKMMNCQFGVLFFGMGLTQSYGRHRNIDNAICLVRDLNVHTKFVMQPMRGHYNVVGFSEVLGWQAGFPYAVDFGRGFAWYNPGETTANDVLQRGECDAALVIASDPVSHFPRKSVEHLAKIPLVAIDIHPTPTTQIADVVIPSAIAGIEVEGTAYRMDSVPLRLRKIKEPPEGVLSDEEIMRRLLARVRGAESGVQELEVRAR
ncbi:formylmethanofuran dehydrogenase subunit B [Candidatus Pyrohabitans sp.]